MGVIYTLYNSNLCRESVNLGRLVTTVEGEYRFEFHTDLVNYVYNQLKSSLYVTFSIVSGRADFCWAEGFEDQEGKIPLVTDLEDLDVSYTILVDGVKKLTSKEVGVIDLISDIYFFVEENIELRAVISPSKREWYKRQYDWLVESIFGLVGSGKLVFKDTPRWSEASQKLFVESVSSGFPVPIIVLRSQGKKLICVDGNQRLAALMNHKRRVEEQEERDWLSAVNFDQQLENQTMSVVVLYKASDVLVESIRKRLN